jgi:uncharacterized protein (TIGR03437 family)
MLAALLLAAMVTDSNGPFYTAASIANSAASVAGLYAPNTLVTIYGQNLGTITRAISSVDIRAGMLPTTLSGSGVRVLINQIPADIYYVSPGQVNLLIPTILVAGPATVQLEFDGRAGPPVQIVLGDAAPAFFQQDGTTVLATHGDYSLVTADSPARGGEEIVLYSTGLGATIPAAIPNQIPVTAASLASMQDFQVLLNGVAIDPRNIAYAGVVPGYAGLYQVNVILPPDAPANPEIRVAAGQAISPPQRFLPLQ